jgi:ketosteroid isomerase-like protein
MPGENDTRKIVKTYFDAWTTNKIDEAYATLASNLEFVGPTASYKSAEEFRPALINFAKMTKRAQVVDFVVQGDRAAMLYECELPQPIGTLRIASFFKVENGKIRTYETQFDATELRKVLARAPGG